MAGKYLKKASAAVRRHEQSPPGNRPTRQKKPPHPGGRSVIWTVLTVVFAVTAIFSGWKLLSTRREYQKGSELYHALAESALMMESKQDDASQDQNADQTPEAKPATQVPTNVDFSLLQSIDTNTVGWIWSDGTQINYPVVHGNDNSYYLNHLIDGSYNSNGSIFVDCRNAPGFADRNTIIYGHNMLNGAMFASLCEYGSAGYYEEHPTLRLITPEGSYTLEVFSGYVTPGTSDIYQLSFTDEADFLNYIQRIRLMSDFASDVVVTGEDRIVTLSTCAYDYDDARYVVHCKLVSGS